MASAPARGSWHNKVRRHETACSTLLPHEPSFSFSKMLNSLQPQALCSHYSPAGMVSPPLPLYTSRFCYHLNCSPNNTSSRKTSLTPLFQLPRLEAHLDYSTCRLLADLGFLSSAIPCISVPRSLFHLGLQV